MWIVIVLACSAIGLAATLRQFRFVQDYPTRLLIVVLWARLSIGALHAYTTKNLGAGLSISALATIGFTGLLLLAAPRRAFAAPHFVVFLPLIAIIAISAAFSLQIKGLINEIIAWAMFAAVMQTTLAAIAANGMDRAMRAIMAPFLTPILLQLASIAFGVSVGSEEDGSRSYIGGYVHEAVFSRILMIFIVAAMLVRWRSGAARLGLLLYGLIALFLSNYRTTIIAVLPVAGVVAATLALSVFRPRYRPTAIAGALLAAVIGAAVAIPLLPDRYAEIFVAASKIEDLVQPSIAFTDDEKRLFSHRFYLWSQYVERYLEGNPAQILFGFGPFSDQGKFVVAHAHSSYVQYLYEYGIFGCLYLIFMLAFNATYVLRIADPGRQAIVLAMHLGFVVLNLTTGVMKSVEGLIIYALIMAATIASAQQRPARAAPPVSPPVGARGYG